MRKINSIIAVCLALFALLVWGYTCYQAYSIQTSGGYSLHLYPALFATVLSAAACFGWVLVTWQAARGDGETRCRKCHHILRGISQPICPECGTPI